MPTKYIITYGHIIISKKVIISKPHAAMPQEHHRLDYITLVVDVDEYGDTFSDRLEPLVRLAFLCAMRYEQEDLRRAKSLREANIWWKGGRQDELETRCPQLIVRRILERGGGWDIWLSEAKNVWEEKKGRWKSWVIFIRGVGWVGFGWTPDTHHWHHITTTMFPNPGTKTDLVISGNWPMLVGLWLGFWNPGSLALCCFALMMVHKIYQWYDILGQAVENSFSFFFFGGKIRSSCESPFNQIKLKENERFILHGDYFLAQMCHFIYVLDSVIQVAHTGF